MKTDKPFKNINEQIEILKNRNLIFQNEETAANALSRYGYYEIINGYKDHFLIEPGNDELGFKQGSTFEHIYALYELDKNISRDLLHALEDFEQTFKQALAYTVSENISEIDSSYCAPSHYNTGKTYGRDRNGNIKSDRGRLLKRFNRLKQSDRQPFAVIDNIQTISKLRVVKLNHFTISGNTRISSEKMEIIRSKISKMIE